MVAAVKNRSDIAEVTCITCVKNYAIIYNREDMVDWLSGKSYIQDCLPYLSNGERELLISGICGECFDKIFSQDDVDSEN